MTRTLTEESLNVELAQLRQEIALRAELDRIEETITRLTAAMSASARHPPCRR